MNSRMMTAAGSCWPLLMAALAAILLPHQPAAAYEGLGLIGSALSPVNNIVSTASNMVSGITNPVMGTLGSVSGGLLGQNPLGNLLSNTLGGMGTLTGGQGGLVGNTLRLTTGAVNGITSGIENGLGGMVQANSIGSMANSVTGSLLASQLGRNQVKREAIAEGAMRAGQTMGVGARLHEEQAAASSNQALASGAAIGTAAADQLNGGLVGVGTGLGPAEALAGAESGTAAAAAAAAAAATTAAASNALSGRQALTLEAGRNALAESAAAGADMMANSAINARSASLASNAYREAKLASARDRVNIAGTIQNSARISDATIATHDAAIKAEDSLLGSELAVDSASTVLDSDAAYIPPVTNSLLRSLPYGRIGLRNIAPKPLAHPSVMLPDVWLNGVPVNYLNVPLKMLPYGLGPAASANSVLAIQTALANGAAINGQPFLSNNGILLNELVYDPAYAYMMYSHLGPVPSSSLTPVLANGQLEAQDEVAAANLINMQQLNGAGMAATYQGYGRSNPVPMITGSVSDVNLMPTTTIGTTYPIGSALVIEPRDSYFQDYTDNASSRQNFDERQQ